jgi:hypothetical protein
MMFGAVGDLHGNFDALDRVMARHPDIAFWVCPGDLASDDGDYPRPRAPLYWIKGNNEDFDFVAAQPAGGGTIPNLHFIPNGLSVPAHGLVFAGLGGTFAPTWYETRAAELPAHTARSTGRNASSSKDDKRRHFVHDEVDACTALQNVDVFLSHEAARPFPLPPFEKPQGAPSESRGSRVKDAGKTPINEVLAKMKPRLHLFGHHHRYVVAERQHVPSIGLEEVSRSYLLVDGKTLAHQRLTI